MAGPTNRRCYITVEKPVTTRNATSNETNTSWTTLKSFWVSMEPNRTNEIDVGRGLESMTIWTIRADYWDGNGTSATDRVTTAHRIVYDDRYFEIIGIMPDEEYHREWMCKVREIDLTSSG